jgi:hypothetical protein
MAPSSIFLEEKSQKFCVCEGVILVNPMPRWETVNLYAYIRTPKELGKCFR